MSSSAVILTADDLLNDDQNYASATSSKPDNLDYDLGHLTAFDPSPIELPNDSSLERTLQSLTRDNVQLLFNQIFDLPTEPIPHELGKLALLPKGLTALPREKPIPKPSAPTKWEAFAKLKGIQKKKRGRMVFDEAIGGYAPRFGYKSAKSQAAEAEWAVEAGGNAQTGDLDPWTAERHAKKERIAKNKKQQERNILKSTQGSKNRMAGAIDLKSAVELSQTKLGLNKSSRKSESRSSKNPRHHVDLALSVAQKSTASMGKFDQLRTNEPTIVLPKAATNRAMRHAADERSRSRPSEKGSHLSVLNKVLTGQKDNDNYGGDNRINMDKIRSMGQQQNEKANIDKKRKAITQSSNKKKGGSNKKQRRG